MYYFSHELLCESVVAHLMSVCVNMSSHFKLGLDCQAACMPSCAPGQTGMCKCRSKGTDLIRFHAIFIIDAPIFALLPIHEQQPGGSPTNTLQITSGIQRELIFFWDMPAFAINITTCLKAASYEWHMPGIYLAYVTLIYVTSICLAALAYTSLKLFH
jgi:hypothetical protein